MQRSTSLVFLLFALCAAFVMLAGSAGGLHVPAKVPASIDVDKAPTFRQDTAFLGFVARPQESGVFRFQLGLGPEGPCKTTPPPLLLTSPPLLSRHAERPMGVREHVPQQAVRPMPNGAALKIIHRPALEAREEAFVCHHRVDLNEAHQAPNGLAAFGPILAQRIEAGLPARLEASIDLDRLQDMVPPELMLGNQFFLRVWKEGAAESVVLAPGASYAPPATPSAVDRASTAARQDATLLLAGLAATSGAVPAKSTRGKEWDLPLPWPLLWLFTRLRRSDLLDHRTRRLIHDLIEANPGIRFGALREQSGLATGVLTHHLSMMEDHGLVVSVRRAGQRHLYPKLAVRRDEPQDVTDRQRQILGLLASARLTQAQIASHLRLTQQAVSYHLHRLTQKGRVLRERGPAQLWRYAAGSDPRSGPSSGHASASGTAAQG